MNIFFISDTHFDHKNIIKYENRPFNDIDEMNNTLINNWNKVVHKKDIIFHLGDVGLDENNLINIVPQLNGIKILILGNHDKISIKFWEDLGFTEVYKYPIIFKNFFILSHKPLYLNDNMPYVNIHGHIHSQKLEGNHYFNASVENINYMPISFNTIKHIIFEKQ